MFATITVIHYNLSPSELYIIVGDPTPPKMHDAVVISQLSHELWDPFPTKRAWPGTDLIPGLLAGRLYSGA